MSKAIVNQDDNVSDEKINAYQKFVSLQQSINAFSHYSSLCCEEDDDYSIKQILVADIQSKFDSLQQQVLFSTHS